MDPPYWLVKSEEREERRSKEKKITSPLLEHGPEGEGERERPHAASREARESKSGAMIWTVLSFWGSAPRGVLALRGLGFEFPRIVGWEARQPSRGSCSSIAPRPLSDPRPSPCGEASRVIVGIFSYSPVQTEKTRASSFFLRPPIAKDRIRRLERSGPKKQSERPALTNPLREGGRARRSPIEREGLSSARTKLLAEETARGLG